MPRIATFKGRRIWPSSLIWWDSYCLAVVWGWPSGEPLRAAAGFGACRLLNTCVRGASNPWFCFVRRRSREGKKCLATLPTPDSNVLFFSHTQIFFENGLWYLGSKYFRISKNTYSILSISDKLTKWTLAWVFKNITFFCCNNNSLCFFALRTEILSDG